MIRLSDFYKNIFGCKVYKISLDAGCTCPNRDGTKGTGGCIFCSARGSGDFIASVPSVSEQYVYGRKLIENKAKGRGGQAQCLYMPYFQAFTSSYGNAEKLEKLYTEALNQEDVCGLAIATRPDCIDKNIVNILKKLAQNVLSATNKKPFFQIELGLQTSNESTGNLINRSYTNCDYEEAVKLIKQELPQAHVVTHIIFGLPKETEKDMINTIDFMVHINQKYSGTDYFGIKITNLYVLKNTVLAEMLEKGNFVPLEMDKYFELVKEALTHIPENCVVHRLNGDPPKNEAVSPLWCLNKKAVLTQINRLTVLK